MVIAIEAQRIFRREKHGMDFVILEVLRCLQKMDHSNSYHVLVAKGEDVCLQSTGNMKVHVLSCPSYPLWEQVALPAAVRRIKPDLLHCTSNTAPLHVSCPLVLTLHDIIFLEKKTGKNKSLYQEFGRIYRRLVVPAILKKCAKVITVSGYEKDTIVAATGLDAEKVKVVYNGVGKAFVEMDKAKAGEVASRYSGGRVPFVFFLGNTDPKKNTRTTLRAYALYARQAAGNALPLLVADLKAEYIDALCSSEGMEDIRGMIHTPGYIANSDLPAIYNCAAAFLYTSLRESFGIPLLEAMSCGTPVITSDRSALPEVAGKDAILVDPHSEEAIAEALTRAISDQEFRCSTITYGLERAKRFSWDETARGTLSIYREVVDEH